MSGRTSSSVKVARRTALIISVTSILTTYLTVLPEIRNSCLEPVIHPPNDSYKIDGSV